MRRADRLFDVIQTLRTARSPMTAAQLAARLEVTVRTIYRDIAALQASRVPIEGAAGIGYVLRRGFELPPVMFTPGELDAISVGVRMVQRLRDPTLDIAAESVLSKITAILPDQLRPRVANPAMFVSAGDAARPRGISLADVRLAIHDSRKMRIAYRNGAGDSSKRTIWPVALAYYVDVTLIAAWCELRADFRHFRVDRVVSSTMLEEQFPTEGGRLLERWRASQAVPELPGPVRA
ncbi:helix-turn-helix transcriptional regulator [Rhodopila sp.]|jgi:predicted DNA-binding transcriptional regulator YafY|uniref:helix-turn-helix transcriptional regulator n=1 Tax=Rhodopila sp. TaxID=2480087 RepID=UPI002BBA29B8|nr:YafY family protein [Rhodopila sp.]HVZ09819.1 YafY family protein [Rhodopila sp.]